VESDVAEMTIPMTAAISCSGLWTYAASSRSVIIATARPSPSTSGMHPQSCSHRARDLDRIEHVCTDASSRPKRS
jgi:hypothetical protein